MKRELTLDELLADPLVLTVMAADRIHPEKVGRQLRRIGDRLNNNADSKSVPCWMIASGQEHRAEKWNPVFRASDAPKRESGLRSLERNTLGEACTW
ncbi:hypothetical protein [Pleomorphomonas sp. PLEO]|uniref:hypothetical protein n=1 Tax=Pleomorphomonas sp. PLEO TaxID=3239306 RepID=UPI00351F098B